MQRTQPEETSLSDDGCLHPHSVGFCNHSPLFQKNPSFPFFLLSFSQQDSLLKYKETVGYKRLVLYRVKKKRKKKHFVFLYDKTNLFCRSNNRKQRRLSQCYVARPMTNQPSCAVWRAAQRLATYTVPQNRVFAFSLYVLGSFFYTAGIWI